MPNAARSTFRTFPLLALLLCAAPAGAGGGAWPASASALRATFGQEDFAPRLARYDRLIGAIMTEAERTEWQGLGSDAQRSEFLSRFWEVRDPTPGTERNEMREIFMQRAERAARMFAEGETPGYATDRGRVLLVYGLPDEIEARATDGATAAEEVWTYTRAPYRAVLRFAIADGAYSLASPPPMGNEPFLKGADAELRQLLASVVRYPSTPTQLPGTTPPAVGETPASGDGSAAAPPTVKEPPGIETTVAPEVRAWMQLIFSGVSRADLGLRHRLSFFPVQDGTYTVLSFKPGKEGLTFYDPDAPVAPLGTTATGAAEGAEGNDLPAGAAPPPASGTPPPTPPVQPPAAAAATTAPTTTTAAATATADAKPPAPDQPARANFKVFGAFLQGEPGHETTVHQFIVPFDFVLDAGEDTPMPTFSLGVTLVPGTYRLAWGVMDMRSERFVTRDQVVTIPDFAGSVLALTAPLVARPPHVEPAAPMTTAQVYRGVPMGKVLIDDDLDREFAADDTVEVVVVATGWEADPAVPGRPKLEVHYRVLLGEEGDQSLARLPVQSLDFSVLGQQIPLGQIRSLAAGGTYRIEVRVRDLISGQEATAETAIRIRPLAPDPRQ